MASQSLARKSKTYRSVFSLIFLLFIIGINSFAISDSGGFSLISGIDEAELNMTNEIWVLLCAALVFFMQAGFLCYEVGLARPQHTAAVAIKNIVDWAISTLAFTVVGFGLMFGDSVGGFIGNSYIALANIGEATTTVAGPTFFLFQLAFAGTAITLVSGSLVERTTLLAYAGIAAALGLVIYPVFGHWVWGNTLNPENNAWLADLGFHDFAGGSVVHLLGATVALVGIKMVGPRIGRFGPNGEPRDMAGSSISLSLLGTIILWLGWWGFNGGSLFAFNLQVIDIIVLTNIAAVAGLVGAGLYGYLVQERFMLSTKLVGGALGGLVGITPAVDWVGVSGALAIGLAAGIAVSWSTDLLLMLKIDDALGVFPIHGAASITGLILVPIFAVEGAFTTDVAEQIAIQLVGVIVCIAWAAGTSSLVFWTIRKFVGLRIDPQVEMTGATIDGPWPYQEFGKAPGAPAPGTLVGS